MKGEKEAVKKVALMVTAPTDRKAQPMVTMMVEMTGNKTVGMRVPL